MSRQMTNITICGALALSLLGAGSAIAAQRTVTVVAEPEVFHERVSYADLNLASSSGERTLSQRVSAAAHRVCRPYRYQVMLDTREQLACFSGAIADARPQVAMAVKRATEIAATGTSSIPAVALSISARF